MVKQHITPDRRLILAVCDTGLLGQDYSEGSRQLDLRQPFYGGSETGKEELLGLMKKAYIVNLVGEESVGCALEAKIISESNVVRISGVPHAQALLAED